MDATCSPAPLGTGELAERLDVSDSAVRRWIRYGLPDAAGVVHRLPARLVGKRHKVAWADYQAWQSRYGSVPLHVTAPGLPTERLSTAADRARARLAARRRSEATA